MKRAIIYITPEMLGFFLTATDKAHIHKCIKGLPVDAKYITMRTQEEKARIGIIYESEEFADVSKGGILPEIEYEFEFTHISPDTKRYWVVDKETGIDNVKQRSDDIPDFKPGEKVLDILSSQWWENVGGYLTATSQLDKKEG